MLGLQKSKKLISELIYIFFTHSTFLALRAHPETSSGQALPFRAGNFFSLAYFNNIIYKTFLPLLFFLIKCSRFLLGEGVFWYFAKRRKGWRLDCFYFFLTFPTPPIGQLFLSDWGVFLILAYTNNFFKQTVPSPSIYF